MNTPLYCEKAKLLSWTFSPNSSIANCFGAPILHHSWWLQRRHHYIRFEFCAFKKLGRGRILSFGVAVAHLQPVTRTSAVWLASHSRVYAMGSTYKYLVNYYNLCLLAIVCLLLFNLDLSYFVYLLWYRTEFIWQILPYTVNIMKRVQPWIFSSGSAILVFTLIFWIS